MPSPERDPLIETQARPKQAAKISLKTELIHVLAAAPSKKAVIGRSAEDCEQDGAHGEQLPLESQAISGHGWRSASQLEMLRRAFWLHRRDLQRWERGREVHTRRRRTNSELVAFWVPPMPRPEYERLARDPMLGIHLPVASVVSFFDEYKKQVRRDIKNGDLPADMVSRGSPSTLVPDPDRTPAPVHLTPERVRALQLPTTNVNLPPRGEWPEPKE